MPNEVISIDMLKYIECYDMQKHFDELYDKSSKKESFDNLMELILSKNNILLAYKNLKMLYNHNIHGVDNLTINSISSLSLEQVVNKVRSIVIGKNGNYFPKPVKYIIINDNFENNRQKMFGIPCIWDKLIQQCIKQVIEPICEAKFSKNSYGYRPYKTVEHAIAKAYFRAQKNNLYQVIQFDIDDFYNKVNHTKLLHQLWSLGIHDKHLLYIIRRILKSTINNQDGSTTYPSSGIVQAGILMPLFVNIVLNELDHWIESQWEETPLKRKFTVKKYANTTENKGHVYRCLRVKKLKEMFIVRYGEEFRIFCRTKTDAIKTKEAVGRWIQKRLKLNLNSTKTKIVNIKRKDFTFIGFRIKVRYKRKKFVVRSHIEYKRLSKIKDRLVKQAKNIAKPRSFHTEYDEVKLFNSMVLGIQKHYRIATNINLDCHILYRAVMTILTNRLKVRGSKGRLKRYGRTLTKTEYAHYGSTKLMRYISSGEPIYPIALIQCKPPMHCKIQANCYTENGRKLLQYHNSFNYLIKNIVHQSLYNRSLEYIDNKIALYDDQNGRCAITGIKFKNADEIHCHHILPTTLGGMDNKSNLVLILDMVHRLIHATDTNTIQKYINLLQLNNTDIDKINSYRKLAHLNKII